MDEPEGMRKIGSTVVRHFNNYNYPLTLGGHQALKRMWQNVEEQITATCAGNHMSGEKEEWFFFLFFFFFFFFFFGANTLEILEYSRCLHKILEYSRRGHIRVIPHH